MTVKKPSAELRAQIADVAMPILLERLGGSVTITTEEYEAFGAKYGGHRRVAVKTEYRDGTLHMSLISRPDTMPEGPTT